MLSRNILFGLGVLALLAGAMLSVLWFHQSAIPSGPIVSEIPTDSILVASHPIPAGTLLHAGDLTWGEVPAAEVVGADIVRSSMTETKFVGAVTRQAFTAREPLTAVALVSPGDSDFLVAALAPGYRAVSIAVDAAESASGLITPGDHVDVLLTQNFAAQGTDAGHRSVGETVLRDLRVIAVDQTITAAATPSIPPTAVSESRIPKTVTLEVTERQGAVLLVADQIGKVSLALRGLRDQDSTPSTANEEKLPTWASDVSPAIAKPAPAPSETSQRSIEVIHGAKIERRCVTNAGLIPCP